jgi:hypothetical protein
MPLSLPAGASCFLDANVFYYHYVNTPPHSVHCTELLRRAVLADVRVRLPRFTRWPRWSIRRVFLRATG